MKKRDSPNGVRTKGVQSPCPITSGFATWLMSTVVTSSLAPSWSTALLVSGGTAVPPNSDTDASGCLASEDSSVSPNSDTDGSGSLVLGDTSAPPNSDTSGSGWWVGERCTICSLDDWESSPPTSSTGWLSKRSVIKFSPVLELTSLQRSKKQSAYIKRQITWPYLPILLTLGPVNIQSIPILLFIGQEKRRGV